MGRQRQLVEKQPHLRLLQLQRTVRAAPIPVHPNGGRRRVGGAMELPDLRRVRRGPGRRRLRVLERRLGLDQLLRGLRGAIRRQLGVRRMVEQPGDRARKPHDGAHSGQPGCRDKLQRQHLGQHLREHGRVRAPRHGFRVQRHGGDDVRDLPHGDHGIHLQREHLRKSPRGDGLGLQPHGI